MQVDLVGIFKAASGSLQRIQGLNQEVWQAIQSAGGKQWRKGDQKVGGWRLLVGIGTYSRSDLELAERLLKLPASPDRVIEFFDVLEIKDMQEFEDYIPGIGKVWGTPVVGFWRDGKLNGASHGYGAGLLLHSLFPNDLPASPK